VHSLPSEKWENLVVAATDDRKIAACPLNSP
jgi:hypothetical protein